MADSSERSISTHGFASEAEEAAETDHSRMSFLEHLDELRRRILYSVYAFSACFAIAFWFWDAMYGYLVRHFQANTNTQLIYNQPMAGFMFSLKITALAALIVASPFIFSQLWLFVAPGLYAREKRVAIPFVFFSTLLFTAGAGFAHFIAFPLMWQFFASYNGIGGVQFFPTIDETFALYVKVTLGMGLVFQMPLLVYFLSKFGIVSAGFLIKHFKYALLIIVILAAIVTPSSDIATQLVFALPMLVLLP